jgi:hypothetical protein
MDHTALPVVTQQLRRTANCQFKLTYEGQYESKAAYFFFTQKQQLQWNLQVSWIHPTQRWDYSSTKSPSLSTHFSTFALDAVCRWRKTLCFNVGTPRARCVSVPRRPKTDALRGYPSGGPKILSQRVLNRTVGRMKENNPPHCCNCFPCTQTGVGAAMQKKDLIHLPVWPNRLNLLF